MNYNVLFMLFPEIFHFIYPLKIFSILEQKFYDNYHSIFFPFLSQVIYVKHYLRDIFLLLLFYHQWRLSNQLENPMKGLCQGVLLTFMIGCFLNSWLKDSTERNFYCMMTAICFAALPLPERKFLVKATMH